MFSPLYTNNDWDHRPFEILVLINRKDYWIRILVGKIIYDETTQIFHICDFQSGI